MSALGGGLAIAFLLSAPAATLPHALPVEESTVEPPTAHAETALSRGEYSDCTPDTTVLLFDGGYGVSLCYETAQGTVGNGKAGIWASAESGLVWFFSRENAELLIKVLNGCARNGYRWVFVAPVTDVAFNLHVTSSRGNRWIYRNSLGETAATNSDVTAFRCTTNDAYGADLAVRAPSVSNSDLEPGESFSLQVFVDNRGDDRSTATTLRYYRSRDSTITTNDRAVGTDRVGALAESGTAANSIGLTAPSDTGTYYYGACVDAVSGEGNTGNNCSSAAAVRVIVPDAPPALESGGDNEVATGDTTTLVAEVADAGDDLYSFGSWSDDEEVAVVEEVRASKSGRLLAVTGKKPGTATITVAAVNSRGEPSGLSTFEVLVASPTADAPTLEAGSSDDALEVSFRATFRPLETRAYDYQVRLRRPQTAWTDIGCQPVRNSSGSEATGAVSLTITGLRAGTTYDIRYRSRRSSSCTAGSPGLWSAVGHATTSGTPINSRPEFSGGSSATVSVNENAGDEVNVGPPVAAADADGLRDILTYSLSGPDAASFRIVPETGQIRTGAGRTYDFESRSTYNVTVEARDVHDETATLPVTIDILDLESNCSQPPRLRLNPRDGLLVLRWRPLPDDPETAAVLGYEIGWRAGSNGSWINRITVRGRQRGFAYLPDLTNFQRYEVRIRPFGTEENCDWSDPVSGSPHPDRSPLDLQDFHDRLGPGHGFEKWRFLATGRFSQDTDGRDVHGSYVYEKTGPDRGLITLEYDEVGRSGCSLSLLFSSLTSGSFLDECGDAGVNTDFDFEEPPPEPENFAPKNQKEFELRTRGRPVLPGLQFGGRFRGTLRGGPFSIPLPVGTFSQTRPSGNPDAPLLTSFGSYEYERVDGTRARLVLCFLECTEDPDERWVIDLEFISSDAAKYTITLHRKGREPVTLDGFIDFKSGDYLSDFPPELVPPRHPPQAAGRDLSGIDAASASTSLSIAPDSLQTILLRGDGIQDIAYTPGDWLEPKDGGNQRMMIVGAGPVAGLATDARAHERTGASDATVVHSERTNRSDGRDRRLHATRKGDPRSRLAVLLATQASGRSRSTLPARLRSTAQRPRSGLRLAVRADERRVRGIAVQDIGHRHATDPVPLQALGETEAGT